MLGCDSVACPTLEELIEACGDKFYSLMLLGNARYRASALFGASTVLETGSTSTEAVAKLWLALHAV